MRVHFIQIFASKVASCRQITGAACLFQFSQHLFARHDRSCGSLRIALRINFIQLLAQLRFFSSGSKWSGFDVKTFAATAYVGRGKFKVSETVSDARRGKASKEAAKRQTLAERKAAANQEGND